MLVRLLFVAATVLAVIAGLVACGGPAVLNALTSKAGFSVQRDIRYAEGDRGTYDLYVPDGAGPRTPVVVFIHGGSWETGSKDIYLFVGQSLASEGSIVAIPNYRLHPEVTFPGFVEDGASAVASIEGSARVGEHGMPAGDHPLILMGHSAGAQIAALLALDEHYLADAGLSTARLAGFVGLAGPYDFLPLEEDRYRRVFPEATRPASQPVAFVGAPMPPMLLLAGDADTTVKPANTLSLAAKVSAAGGNVEAEILPGVDHISAVSAMATALPLGDRSIRSLVLAFIAKHTS